MKKFIIILIITAIVLWALFISRVSASESNDIEDAPYCTPTIAVSVAPTEAITPIEEVTPTEEITPVVVDTVTPTATPGAAESSNSGGGNGTGQGDGRSDGLCSKPPCVPFAPPATGRGI